MCNDLVAVGEGEEGENGDDENVDDGSVLEERDGDRAMRSVSWLWLLVGELSESDSLSLS